MSHRKKVLLKVIILGDSGCVLVEFRLVHCASAACGVCALATCLLSTSVCALPTLPLMFLFRLPPPALLNLVSIWPTTVSARHL